MNKLDFTVDWRPDVDRGATSVEAADDEATLCELQILVGGASLTQVAADGSGGPSGPRVPAARMAEWLMWHWWRLLWEPAGHSIDWSRAHDMACIGGGWLWPNVSVTSDGYRIVLDAKPSEPNDIEPMRHLVDAMGCVTRGAFAHGVDAFLGNVLQRLSSQGNKNGHLRRMYEELMRDRRDDEACLYRRVEALLGFDPDDGDSKAVNQVIDGGRDLGLDAMTEVASDAPLSAQDVRQIADRIGIPSNPSNSLPPYPDLQWDKTGTLAPWRVGSASAQKLRSYQNWGDGVISNDLLEDMCGLGKGSIQGRGVKQYKGVAFSLRTRGQQHVVALNSGLCTSRRFAVARLLGDRLLVSSDENLRPATRSRTYRQQMQRAFAAEFLCPFESLNQALQGDYSEDSMENAATEFGVSTWLVHAHLANHGLMPSDGRDVRSHSVVLAA